MCGSLRGCRAWCRKTGRGKWRAPGSTARNCRHFTYGRPGADPVTAGRKERGAPLTFPGGLSDRQEAPVRPMTRPAPGSPWHRAFFQTWAARHRDPGLMSRRLRRKITLPPGYDRRQGRRSNGPGYMPGNKDVRHSDRSWHANWRVNPVAVLRPVLNGIGQGCRQDGSGIIPNGQRGNRHFTFRRQRLTSGEVFPGQSFPP